jgi:hypothetical protein
MARPLDDVEEMAVAALTRYPFLPTTILNAKRLGFSIPIQAPKQFPGNDMDRIMLIMSAWLLDGLDHEQQEAIIAASRTRRDEYFARVTSNSAAVQHYNLTGEKRDPAKQALTDDFLASLGDFKL